MAITLNGTTGITTPSLNNQGNLTVDGGASNVNLYLSNDSYSSYYYQNTGGSSGVTFPASQAYVWDAGGVERMRIDSAGRVTMPYQTSASYYGAGSSIAMATGWNLLGGSGSGLNVSWSTSGGYNIGSNFDTTNGRFTAPIAGRYLFYIASLSTLGSTNATAYVGLRLAKNGSFTYDLDEGGYYVSKAGTDAQFWPKVTTILNLAQGDYVHAEVYSPVSTSLVQRDSSRFMYSLLG